MYLIKFDIFKVVDAFSSVSKSPTNLPTYLYLCGKMALSIIEDVSQFKSDYLDMTLAVLANGEISELSLKRFLGKYVVILFYPADFSPMPREEILECMAKFEDFKFANCQVN